MLVASSLVLLMIPALGLFEAGLLRKKNTVSIFMQIFFGLALLSVMWFVFGFSLTFGPDTAGLVGNLDWTFLKGVPFDNSLKYAPTIPGVLYAKFEMMFAVITPLLLTGAVAERMKFSAFVLFITAWSFLIYYPLVHWIWGGGWLGKLRRCRLCWRNSNSYKCRYGSTLCSYRFRQEKELWAFNYGTP